MDKVSVVKIARVLNGLVLAALVCNVVALYLVPTVVMTGREGLLLFRQHSLSRRG